MSMRHRCNSQGGWVIALRVHPFARIDEASMGYQTCCQRIYQRSEMVWLFNSEKCRSPPSGTAFYATLVAVTAIISTTAGICRRNRSLPLATDPPVLRL